MNEQEYNRKFVGHEEGDALPPIYKGNKVKIYPGILGKNVKTGKNVRSRKRYGLRRYVFRYEGDQFVYLATRMGQRNGGNTASPLQTLIAFKINARVGAGTVEVIQNFNFSGKNDNGEDVYVSSANSRIRYDSAATRWVWETRPEPEDPSEPPSGPFFVNAFTEATNNSLNNAGTINQIRWTYVNDPYGVAPTQFPATVTLQVKQWYNNNSIDNLNKWPIQNVDANYGKRRNSYYKWQYITPEAGDNTIIPENRPECLTDDLLFQCFKGIKLKHYSIVFVEVMWTWFENRKRLDEINFGYDIANLEWWSPRPFYQKRQKGRIYRIGILDADNGVGKTDKVIFAQRTRIVTTKYFKGGNTALD
jgi:hypothetical protein